MTTSLTSFTPLAAAEIRARRRPLAVFYVFVAELAWALLMSAPAHTWARRAFGARPDGDAVLWEPGGRHLLVWLGQNDAGLGMTSRMVMLLLLVGVVLMQLPLGALLVSLAFSRSDDTAPAPAPAPAEDGEAEPAATPKTGRALRSVAALRVAIGAFLPLAALLALGSLVAIIVLAIGSMVASAVDHGLAESIGDARSFVARVVTLVLFAAIVAIIGVVVDLARAAVAREVGIAAARGASPPGWSVMARALRTAFRTARGGLSRATRAWAWRSGLGVALLGVGYVAAQVLGGQGGAALVGLFFVHQLVVLGRVALRASWLARAMAMIAPVQDAASVKAPWQPVRDENGRTIPQRAATSDR